MRAIADRVNGKVQVRPEAARCRFLMRGLVSVDSHTVDLTFSCSVIALDQDAERQVLAETFLVNRETVGPDEIAAHFTPALRQSLAGVIESQPAEHWTTEAARATLIDAFRAASKPVAFACGVDLLPPFELSVESPTLQRQKIESMQRKLVEQRAVGQAQHVARAAELLKQFQSLRDAAPQLSPGKLLEQVSPVDRGSMLETLLLASASQGGQTLWAVAGPNLVRIDPRQSPPRSELISLPTDLGPLRSVQAGASQLIIGAQAGVMTIDPANPASVIRYADREIASSLGFNAALSTTDMLWATHGEAGIVAWSIDQPDKPLWTIRSQGQGPRNPVALDDSRILCSAGSALLVVDRSGTPRSVESSGASVIFVAIEADAVTVVRADGVIDRLDRDSLLRISSTKCTGEITAAATMPWLGTTRLLLATEDGPVFCIGQDDPLVTQYQSPHRGLRALTATHDMITGMSPDRQRLVLWKTWETRQPCAEIHIASIARHRAADICFA